ncbi:hypothetical protein NL54_13040 [Pantoea stewartii]|uniref:YeeE/YedE family protein n=1 Tax=Pantoea stewartii TaxID=66269 RepID=UPI0005438462|nr:YeeE/YedE thiosulfate transporter family protein [Pantoea stewartii]KHE00957.1 hypothetical protein NL54_13040 [Pantoea stewartii]KHN58560.1 hypothetical protein OI73_21595 [Pantoea stewartii]
MQIDVNTFTPVQSLCGGVLIGTAAGLLIFLCGRIAGISGIIGGLFRLHTAESFWKLAFLTGMILSSVLAVLTGFMPDISLEASPARLIAAGLLVGFGARFGSGCTSGHGVCGLSRLSVRSLTATLVFMAAAIATVYISNLFSA